MNGADETLRRYLAANAAPAASVVSGAAPTLSKGASGTGKAASFLQELTAAEAAPAASVEKTTDVDASEKKIEDVPQI